MNFISSITLQFRDAFSSGFKNAEASFAGMKGALSDLDKNKDMNRLAADLAMASALTEPFRQKLAALIDEPSQLAGAFESSMKNIQAITGLSSAEIKTLGAELNGIGSRTAAGPLAVAAAYNDVAGGITNVTAQMPVLNNAVTLAEAGQADLGVAANGLVKIMNSYGFTVSAAATETERAAEINEKAAWASDVMTQAVGMGVGSMNEFVTAMSPISGVASAVGIGFDEIGSTMAYMTATTDTAATAGTKLAAFMTALQKPNKDLEEGLRAINITSGSAMLAQYGLAESARLVSLAFDGNQDAIAQAMGRQEAMKAVVSLTGGAYSDFAAEFGAGMNGITAAAQAVQVESYESKIGRLSAAQDALKIQIGDDVNAIKGFFVDIGAGFLTNVVSPIMGAPVGGVFQGIAAGAGLAAKGILDLGSGALNTASQLVVLTATLQNAGGFSKLFGSSLTLMRVSAGMLLTPLKVAGMQLAAFSASVKSVGFVQTFQTGITGISRGLSTLGKSIITVLPKLGAWIASVWAAAIAHIAAFWPVYAIIGGIALLAAGAVLLVKNWGAVKSFFVGLWDKVTNVFSAAFKWIKNLLAGVSNKVLAAVAVFMPFIGIPALIIKNWETIKAFFVGLWVQVSELFKAAIAGIKNFFVAAWTKIQEFFAFIWDGMISIVVNAANWFSNVWASVTGAFAAAWIWVGDLFSSVWESIKGVIMGFAAWLQPVIDFIIAPFKAIGAVIGGIIDTVGGWFDSTVDKGNAKLAEMTENTMKAATASPAEPSVSASAVVEPLPPSAMSASANPIAPPTMTTTSAVPIPSTGAGGGGNALLGEHLAAASRKGIAGNINAAASNAFMGASSGPAIDIADYSAEAQGDFSEALRPMQTQILQTPWSAPETKKTKDAPRTITIQNLTLQADGILDVINFVRQLELAVLEPMEAAL